MGGKRASRSQAAKSGADNKKKTEVQTRSSRNAEKENSSTSGDDKMTLCTIPTPGVRAQARERRPGRPPSGKRLAALAREMPAKVRSAMRRSLDPCDNSNDSGLGFDHHADSAQHNIMSDRLGPWHGERNHHQSQQQAKRPKIDIKTEHGDNSDRYYFPDTLRTCKESTSLIRTAPAGSHPALNVNGNQTSSSGGVVPRCVPVTMRQTASSQIPLTAQLTSTSKCAGGEVSLTIIKQPEQQHRARYQTEGSRGAVKDREGNGFPIVQLMGYYQPTTLQVFIGTDVGKVAPHMFYQACKVSGKNSTPCMEKKIEGTCVIELQLDPSKEMSATCDCVGILKERNVDVEHRFPDQLGNRSKKKSTRCRMIFRTTITHEDGTVETLQVCSQPIVCTQPPGIPEICKKSLTSCPASGGLELFVLGKNFLKDTKVYFQLVDDDRHIRWEQAVVPDKEYLQQTHFVCVVPPYRRPDTTEPITVRLCVVSSGKTSEPHQFVYTPTNGAVPSVHVDQNTAAPSTSVPQASPFLLWPSSVSKREQDLGMMPPPESSMVPMASRRPSLSVSNSNDNMSPPLRPLKQEYIDENSQSSCMDSMDHHTERYRHISESSLDVHHGDSNMSMINENSMDMLNHNTMLSQGDNSNISIGGNDSVEMMVRRNSIGRNMCDNSMDVNLSNSRMSSLHEDTTSNSAVMHCANSIVTDRLVLSQTNLLQRPEDLKVMDLRMKMPMATVADLVSSNAPSMATLQSFGVTEPSTSPLPAQSAQSVESFLTNIESKIIPNSLQMKSPVFLSTQRPFLACSTPNDTMLVAKSEAAAIAEQTLAEQTSTIASTVTTTISSMSTSLESTITATPINTEKLDQLVNSTVESHLGAPNTEQITSKLSSSDSSTDVIRDVMLNSRSALMVPPIINTTLSPSPIMSQDLNAPHTSPNISPDVILNSQISPSLMCRSTNNQDTLMPNAICQTTVEASLQPPLLTTPQSATSPIHSHSPLAIAATEPEKAVLFSAAVDLLETQKKLNELDTRSKLDAVVKEPIVSKMMELITMSGQNEMSPVVNNFVAPIMSTDLVAKSDFVIPVPVKEMAGVAGQQDKKHDDRMIPQSFTSLTENELINLINPSCFDQGNNTNYN